MGFFIILFILGMIITFVGSIWGLFQAFNENVVWGFLYLFVPFASLVFYIKYWQNKRIRKTFLIQLSGLGMLLLGGISGITNFISMASKSSKFETNISMGTSDGTTSQFPTNFNISPLPIQTSSPIPEASPQHSSISLSSTNTKYDFKESMTTGYTAYQQGDYETALIYFNRALKERPGNTYAITAIKNTKNAIDQSKVK